MRCVITAVVEALSHSLLPSRGSQVKRIRKIAVYQQDSICSSAGGKWEVFRFVSLHFPYYRNVFSPNPFGFVTILS